MEWGLSSQEWQRRRRLSAAEADAEVAALIAREIRERSGKLNLKGFDIHALPAEISSLDWLELLDISVTGVSDLSLLSGLKALTSLDCTYTQVSDLAPLAGLTRLVTLSCHETDIDDLSPLSGLSELMDFNCGDSWVSDLTPLSALTALVSLDCRRTRVTDLSPISGLTELTFLDFSGTQVSDLSPLSGLTGLTSLECAETQVRDLSSLAGLTGLTSLRFSVSQVSDLSPLSGLTRLTSLECGETQVTDLSPLSCLTGLTSLHCWVTRITDLSPLSGLTELSSLHCWDTRITDLAPLSSLAELISLDCSYTQVSDLTPVANMPSLEHLVCHSLPNCPIPAEVLSQDIGDNCLPRLRSYWANQATGSEPFRQHKLFLLGNGTVGKTQVARRLRGLGFDGSIESTHGIQLHAHPLPALPDGRDARAGERFDARIWDFGGQDIYHGTHALFLKSRAVFLICWEGESERAREHVIAETPYRNRPLAFWLDYVRNLAGPDAPVILVQTQCDRPGAPRQPPLDLSPWDDLAGLELVRTSALKGTGFADLQERIAHAVARLEEPALQMIGSCERAVIDRIAALRRDGVRVLDGQAFAEICAEAGVRGESAHLLHFLHHAGELFHAAGLFGDQIIIDQRWALDAIYTVFDRKECWQAIRANRGRFTLADLAQGVWRDFTPDEREHFLAMMLKCGMAFRYIEEDRGWHDAIYIAPDLLPARSDPSVAKWIDRYWDEGGAVVIRTVHFPLLHDGLMREIMRGIGEDAGLHAIYWQNGLLFTDGRTRAVATIAAQWPDDDGWAGQIVIAAQRARAAELAETLEEHVRQVADRIGLAMSEEPDPAIDCGEEFARARRTARPPGATGDDWRGAADAAEPGFVPAAGAPLRPLAYVSYAWSDGSEAAEANEALVDAFCSAASQRGIEVRRDKTHQRDGGWIADFVEEITRADRVFAMIGGRYWTRPYCMAELHGCWRRSESDREIFKGKVREFLFPDSRMFEPGFLESLRADWQERRRKLQAKDAADLEADEALIVAEAEKWCADAPDIVKAIKGKIRHYEGDIAAYTSAMLDEIEGLHRDGP